MENYSSNTRQGIEQDTYSKFLIFNYLKLMFNSYIMIDKYFNGDFEEYRVDYANLMRNMNNNLAFIVLSPFEEMRKSKGKLFILLCLRSLIVEVYHDSTDRTTHCHPIFPIPYAKT